MMMRSDPPGQGFRGLDAAKFLLAILVIAAHTRPLEGCPYPFVTALWDNLVRLAVPFFFLCTGYFLAPRIRPGSPGALWKSFRKTGKLYLLWTLLYTPLAVVYYLRQDYGPGRALATWLRGLLLQGYHYNSWMLWYLLSALYALALCALLCRLGAGRKLLLLAGAGMYLAGQGVQLLTHWPGPPLSGFPGLLGEMLTLTFGSGQVFTGFLCIPLGMALERVRPGPLVSWLLVLSGVVLGALAGGVTGGPLCCVAAVGLFSLVLPLELKDRPLYPALRRASTVLYFTHMYLWTGYCLLFYRVTSHYGPDSFLVTVLASCALAFVLEMARNGPFCPKISRNCPKMPRK